jgi:hypothetical protein
MAYQLSCAHWLHEETSGTGRSFYKQRPPWSDRFNHLYFGLFREFERIVNLDSQVPNGALEFGMPEEQLYSPQVLRSLIDE